jgi:NitT/TauT family transport system substrate-binding protein
MLSRSITRRHFLGSTAAGMAFVSAGGRSLAQGNTFRFMTPFSFSLSFSSVLYGEAAGYYEAEGLDMEIVAAKGAAMAAQMVLADQMDSSRTGGTNYIISKVENAVPLISIATIAQLSPFFVISAAENPVDTVADLEGRTVGMASLGGSMESTLDLLMLGSGLSPEKVNKVKVADSAASFALIEGGRAGAFIGNTSSMIQAHNAREGVRSIPMDDGMPGQVYVAREDDIEQNADKYVAFLRATHKAAAEVSTADDLTPVLEAIAGKFGVNGLKDMETAKADLAANARNWAAKGQENLLRNIPEVWDNAVELLSGAGLIASKPDPKSLYTNTLLEKALG